MLIPPLGAAADSVTVQESCPDPVMDALLQENALKVAVVDALAPNRTIGKLINKIMRRAERQRLSRQRNGLG
jgi:aspartokinase-like uncharacterized kinase